MKFKSGCINLIEAELDDMVGVESLCCEGIWLCCGFINPNFH